MHVLNYVIIFNKEVFDINIYLYSTKSDKRVIKKIITQKSEYTNVCLKGTVDIVDPTIYLTGIDIDELTRFNYLYIPKFNRYYFIKKITVDTGKVVSISAHVDLLYTFRKDILDSTQLVARYGQQPKHTRYLIDNRLPLDSRKRLINKQFGVELRNTEGYCVLAVSSGVKMNA